MISLFDHLDLLARRWDFRSMGQGLRGVNAEFHTSKVLTVVGVILVVCLGLLLLERFARRNDHAKSYDSPSELFRELCRLHRLNLASRRLLKRLAAQWGLDSPTTLFVEPEYFDSAKLPAEWQVEAKRLSLLRQQLFEAL